MKTLSKIGLLVLVGTLALPSSAAKKPSAMQLPPTVVETAPAKATTQQQHIIATGSLSAWQGIVVRPEVAGHVTKIFFKSGQEVTANTPLVQLNPDIYKAQLAQAQAKFKLAKLAYSRAQELYSTHAVSTADLDQAVENMHVAQGQVEELKAQLAQTLLRAPFEGRLGLKQIDLGDYVTVGQAIVNLQDTDPLQVDFSVPEVYLAKLAVGQKVAIRVDAYPKQVFYGKIYALESLLNTNTRSLAVRARIANPDNRLLPGTFAEVTLFLGAEEPAILVPQTAVIYDSQGAYVYVVKNNHAVQTRVETGYRDSNNVTITKGLTAKDIVVTAGQLKLRDGSQVIVR